MLSWSMGDRETEELAVDHYLDITFILTPPLLGKRFEV